MDGWVEGFSWVGCNVIVCRAVCLVVLVDLVPDFIGSGMIDCCEVEEGCVAGCGVMGRWSIVLFWSILIGLVGNLDISLDWFVVWLLEDDRILWFGASYTLW